MTNRFLKVKGIGDWKVNKDSHLQDTATPCTNKVHAKWVTKWKAIYSACIWLFALYTDKPIYGLGIILG